MKLKEEELDLIQRLEIGLEKIHTLLFFDRISLNQDDSEILINLLTNLQKENVDLEADRDYYKEMCYKIAFPEEEIRIKGLGED